MHSRDIGIAALVAIFTFAVVAIGVTELLVSSIAFSAIVGLPVGIIAGLLAGLLTIIYLDQRERTARPPDAGGATEPSK